MIPLLEVDRLNKHFGGLHATCDVSFAVPEGQLLAIIGPNGAGKTTLFNLITNLFAWSSGDVRLAGRSLRGLSATSIAAQGLIRTFQTARVFPGMTVLDNVLVGRHRMLQPALLGPALWLPGHVRRERDARVRAEGLLEMVGLGHVRHANAADLPIGAQKTLEVVRALIAQPRILLLDEPAAGLNDTETAELASLLAAISRSSVTVVLVEHNMPLVMGIADEVLVLEAGRVVMSGPPAIVQRDPRVIEAYLGPDVEPAKGEAA